MLNYESEKTGTLSRLKLKGDMNIQNACEIKRRILSECETESDLILEISHLNEIDLSFVQILLALKIEAEKSGFRISFESDKSGRLINYLSKSGFPPALLGINENQLNKPEENNG